MTKALLICIICYGYLFGCGGCTDASSGLTSQQNIKLNYQGTDTNLATTLTKLGATIKSGYEADNAAALIVEKIARLNMVALVEVKKMAELHSKNLKLTQQLVNSKTLEAGIGLSKAESLIFFGAKELENKSEY